MARSFADRSPHDHSAFMAEQIAAFRARAANPSASAQTRPAAGAPVANPDQPSTADPIATQIPAQTREKKKMPARAAAVTEAKNVLRASRALTRKSVAPKFIQRAPDLARHRRKCAVCQHPERETIEELFIHWHSPNTIASCYSEDENNNITWVSIYRHAYAFGLDEIRRRNLRWALELVVEQAADVTATSAAIIAATRALGSCVTAGRWHEPPKSVHVTNIIKKESAREPLPAEPAPPAEPLPPAGEDAFAAAPSSAPSANDGVSEDSSAVSSPPRVPAFPAPLRRTRRNAPIRSGPAKLEISPTSS